MRLAITEAKVIVLSLVLLTVVLAWLYPFLALIPLAFLAFVFYFFRDPCRQTPVGADLILAPADGTVTGVAQVDCPWVGPAAHQVTIFMSPLDVHLNRSPVAGQIVSISHRPGQYLPAMNPKAPLVNEKRTYDIQGRLRLRVVQVAGIMARRTVSWVEEGQELARGEKIGMIKFGSCAVVTFPADCRVTVAEGAKVRGGLTIIGEVNRC